MKLLQQGKCDNMNLMRQGLIHKRGSFLRDSVFSASDGLITTFAVVAGSVGASLNTPVVLILGFANLFADGFSMSASTYLGVKSEVEFEESEGDSHVHEASPLSQAFVTFFSFGVAGFLPLLPYVMGLQNAFILSLSIVMVSMFGIGLIKSVFTKKGTLRSGFEILVIGGMAAFVAYVTGDLIEKIVNLR